MSLAIKPLSAQMGAEVTGVDLGSSLDASTVAALNAALDRHVVLCVRGQQLSPAQLVGAARAFGEPVAQVNDHLNFPELPAIGVLSSEDRDVLGGGERVIRGTTWHTDHSFSARPPRATILYALVVPGHGGETSFCNTRAAYAALPAAMRARLEGLRAVHSYESSRSPRRMMVRSATEVSATPDVVHPLVRTHPATGTKALYLSTTRLERIEDMDRAGSDALVDELIAHATQPCFCYDHHWQVGDLVIWDNTCSMHHANANYSSDEKRLLHRIIIAGEQPS